MVGSGPVQIDGVVQVAQQPVAQTVGQGPQLLLGVLEYRIQRCVTGNHLRPVQPGHQQGHRVFGGEPADGARQIDIGAQVLVPACGPRRRSSPLGRRRIRRRPWRIRATAGPGCPCGRPWRRHPAAVRSSRCPAGPTAARRWRRCPVGLHRGQRGGNPAHPLPGLGVGATVSVRPAWAASTDAHRCNDVPPAGSSTDCPAWC